jgi:aspartate ammonia-lyase
MRQEHDSLGEFQLSDDEYFGLSTARILAVADLCGPRIPHLLAVNVVRVRQAQALALGQSGAWTEVLSESIQAAAEQLIADEAFFAAQLRICSLHGGGARSIVANIDEVLANVALQMQRKSLGDYHWVAPLLRLDNGFSAQQVCLIALHISLSQLIEELVARLTEAVSLLQSIAQELSGQATVAQMDYQDVKITDMGSGFACCADGLARVRRQVYWYRSELLRLWSANPDELRCLQALLGIDCVQDETGRDFPVGSDLYIGLSGMIKTAANLLLQFCNELKQQVCLSKEIEWPKRVASPVFNPAGREVVVPDTISQIGFYIIGCDAAVTSAATSGNNAIIHSFPLISTCLVNSVQQLTVAVKLLINNCLIGLRGNSEAGLAAVVNTPLQAEKLISLIGYERAVQVARIAALTEKPVHTVVLRMKLLNEEQVAKLFTHAPVTNTNMSEE